MTLIVFILILSLLIFVHEFGHFIIAKKSGIRVDEFGFGLPPRVFGKKIGETIYSINLLPFGGFVRLFGEDGEAIQDKKNGDKRAFYQKSIFVRFSVLAAGVTMNLLLGIVCFSLIYFKTGIPVPAGRVSVVGIVPNSPAHSAGIAANETIFKINNIPLVSSKDFIKHVDEQSGNEVEILVGNDKKARLLRIMPRVNPPEGEGPLGVVITDTEMKHYPWWQMPYLATREGMKEALSWSGNIVGSLKSMIVGLITQGKLPSDVAGPIGIYQITGQATKAGWLAVVQFIGILSINLAILNIMPLPALDGGRIAFLGYEAVTRKKVKSKVEALVNNIGIVVLLGLMLLITLNDIVRLVNK